MSLFLKTRLEVYIPEETENVNVSVPEENFPKNRKY